MTELLTNEASVTTSEGAPTGNIQRELERRKYSPIVAKYLNVSDKYMKKIHWTAHERAMVKVGT